MIEKILVAVAGAGQAEQMLKALMEIPSISQAHVTILHVIPSQISATAMAEKLEEGGKIMATAIQTLGLNPQTLLTQNVLTPRQAFFAPVETLPIAQACDRVSAELVCPYPPGIPILMPGEVITEGAIAFLQQVLNRPQSSYDGTRRMSRPDVLAPLFSPR